MEPALSIGSRSMCRLFQIAPSKVNHALPKDFDGRIDCAEKLIKPISHGLRPRNILKQNYSYSVFSTLRKHIFLNRNDSTFSSFYQAKCCHTDSKKQEVVNLIDESVLKTKVIEAECLPVFNKDDEITEFLNDNKLPFVNGYLGVNFTCPMLKTDSKKIHVSYSGHFYCEKCLKYGDWEELKVSLGAVLKHKKKKSNTNLCLPDWIEKLPNSDATDLWNKGIAINLKLNKETLDNIMYNLAIQEIDMKTLLDFHARIHPDSNGLLLPVYNSNNEIAAVKVIKFHETEDYLDDDFDTAGTVHKVDIQHSLYPNDHLEEFLGWHLVKRKCSHLIITANDFDAMAIHQHLKSDEAVISFLNDQISLSPIMLPKLEKFDRITFWLGNDDKSWSKAKYWSTILNVKRCHLVRLVPSALMAIRQKRQLKTILTSALPAKSPTVLTFSDFEDKVRQTIENIEFYKGIQWNRFSALNDLLKGHRRGELTILTGRTGCGKTTLLSDLSLDLASQGVNTLWGSFEISNPRLASIMLSQYSNCDIYENIERFKELAKDFSQLPLYFMSFFGQENITKVIETMRHAVFIHDINHIIIDNLQFMMGCESTSSNFDKYLKQDIVISKLRSFASTMDCHVTLVIHPKKEKEGDSLTISSVYGSGKATQEADNVLIIQEDKYSSTNNCKYLEVVKNRYDGTMGRILLKFDKISKRFVVPDAKKRDINEFHEKKEQPKIDTLSKSYSESQTKYIKCTPSSFPRYF